MSRLPFYYGVMTGFLISTVILLLSGIVLLNTDLILFGVLCYLFPVLIERRFFKWAKAR